MYVEVNGKQIETDEQGFCSISTTGARSSLKKTAAQDGLTLYDESWGLIGYFREYYQQNSSYPSMRQLVLNLGRQSGEHFHDRKQYEKFVYKLFPRDPIRELCKLAGLPKPEPGIEAWPRDPPRCYRWVC